MVWVGSGLEKKNEFIVFSLKLLHLIKNVGYGISLLLVLVQILELGVFLSGITKNSNNLYFRKLLTKENNILPKAMVKWKKRLSLTFTSEFVPDMNKYVIANKVTESHF